MIMSDVNILRRQAFWVGAEFVASYTVTFREKLMDLVADALVADARPDQLAPLAYILLGSGWRMP